MEGFLLLYATALVLDQTESWRAPAVALALIALTALTLWRGPARPVVLALLGISLVDGILRAPDLANHHNLTLFLHVVLLLHYGAASLFNRRMVAFDDALFDAVAPSLRAAVIVCYFFAGFHKLNLDFFDPKVSCAGWFIDKLTGIYLGGIVRVPPLVVAVMAVVVAACELCLAVLLVRRQGRAAALVLAWALHGVLALAVFFDFSALMFALLWTFVPGRVARQTHQTDHGRLASPVCTLVALQLVGAAVSGAAWSVFGEAQKTPVHIMQGMVLNLGALLVAVPLWRAWQKPGLTTETRTQFRLSAAAVALILGLFASSNYLGLRTAGTFSMFSNLRTEAGAGNHVLLGRGWPLFNYQDDVVWIISLRAPREQHLFSLVGMGIPRVELMKRIADWRANGSGPISARLRDGKNEYDSVDLTVDPRWPVTTMSWPMRLLDFRAVQPEPSPNSCRW